MVNHAAFVHEREVSSPAALHSVPTEQEAVMASETDQVRGARRNLPQQGFKLRSFRLWPVTLHLLIKMRTVCYIHLHGRNVSAILVTYIRVTVVYIYMA